MRRTFVLIAIVVLAFGTGAIFGRAGTGARKDNRFPTSTRIIVNHPTRDTPSGRQTVTLRLVRIAGPVPTTTLEPVPPELTSDYWIVEVGDTTYTAFKELP